MYNEAVALEYLKDWEGALEKMRAFVEKYPDDAQGQHELTFLDKYAVRLTGPQEPRQKQAAGWSRKAEIRTDR